MLVLDYQISTIVLTCCMDWNQGSAAQLETSGSMIHTKLQILHIILFQNFKMLRIIKYLFYKTMTNLILNLIDYILC